jgi:hypothetical protein
MLQVTQSSLTFLVSIEISMGIARFFYLRLDESWSRKVFIFLGGILSTVKLLTSFFFSPIIVVVVYFGEHA